MMTPVELIDKMIVLLTPEKVWIKNTTATDANGSRTPPGTPEAACWCMSGARMQVQLTNGLDLNDPVVMVAREAMDQVARKHGCVSPTHYNDLKTTTHRKMLNFLHEARIVALTLQPTESMKI